MNIDENTDLAQVLRDFTYNHAPLGWENRNRADRAKVRAMLDQWNHQPKYRDEVSQVIARGGVLAMRPDGFDEVFSNGTLSHRNGEIVWHPYTDDEQEPTK